MAKQQMKNILVIDGAINCVYDIFAATREEFALIFPKDTDIAFSDDVWDGGDKGRLQAAFDKIWTRRVPKAKVRGIHGTIFYQLDRKKQFYPTMRDEEAVNPDGTRLRQDGGELPINRKAKWTMPKTKGPKIPPRKRRKR